MLLVALRAGIIGELHISLRGVHSVDTEDTGSG